MPKRVLVLDDDAAVLATLEHLLKRWGHEIALAETAAKGFALADSHAFDLLISDLVMPEEDGVAVIRRFRARFPELPIIAMSGGARLGTPDTLAAAREAGANALLKKPFTVDTLAAAIEAAAIGIRRSDGVRS